ncbi:MAG: hypothetical protein Q6352_006225 [Candidatus Freyrarchaeum guaymaensis]|nr:hypothetical protein [Candidatus Sigynarchaeota archaeon]
MHRGWYYIPEKRDVWDFLARDKHFKVLIKQTAASIWNHDFVHRNVYRSRRKPIAQKRIRKIRPANGLDLRSGIPPQDALRVQED